MPTRVRSVARYLLWYSADIATTICTPCEGWKVEPQFAMLFAARELDTFASTPCAVTLFLIQRTFLSFVDESRTTIHFIAQLDLRSMNSHIRLTNSCSQEIVSCALYENISNNPCVAIPENQKRRDHDKSWQPQISPCAL